MKTVDWPRLAFLSAALAWGITICIATDSSFSQQTDNSPNAKQNRDFWDGYRVGYLTAIRDENEGKIMCTKNIPLLEVLGALQDYKRQHPSGGEMLTNDVVKSALSSRFPCKRP